MPRRSRPPTRFATLGLVWAAGGVLAARRVDAQAVRIEVRDASDQRPVGSAVVSLRPEAATARPASGVTARGVTSAAGVRTLGVPPGRYRLEVRRIGQQPFSGPLVTVAGVDTARVSVAVPRAPVVLTAVQVRGTAGCGAATDSSVIVLWDAAQTALAGMLRDDADAPAARPTVSRPTRVAFERTLDTAGVVVAETQTLIPDDSTDRRTFWAVDSTIFERHGFALGSVDEGAQFHGLDERVLLSNAFARTHCFSPARGGGPDATWLGVRFSPVPRRRVPEVTGVVWMDSATAELRQVEYAYVWRQLPRQLRDVGGRTEFARLPDGPTAVRAWRIRLPLLDRGALGQLRVTGYVEAGGNLAPLVRPRVRVTGTVFDSLAGRALAGAVVTRAGAPGVAVTDSAGAFALDSVEAGPGAFVFSHAALDSIGLADVSIALDLSAARDSAAVVLATPSRTTAWSRTCGATPPPRTGALAGMVRDARTGAGIRGATATVTWIDVDTLSRGVRAIPRARFVRTDSTGAFQLCEAPMNVALRVRAASEPAGAATGWVDVVVGARGLAVVDLLAPPADSGGFPTVVAQGVVRDSAGAPAAGVQVTVQDVPGAAARTESDGTFRVPGVPAGTRTLLVRAPGYSPQTVSVGLRTEAPAPVEVRLRRIVQLATAVVRGRGPAGPGSPSAIDRRLQLGFGSKLDSTVFLRAPSMHSALRQVPYVTLRTRGGGVALENDDGCEMAVAVDERVTDWEEVAGLPPNVVQTVEVYRRSASIPARFQGLLVQASRREGKHLCGLAVVWTRRAR